MTAFWDSSRVVSWKLTDISEVRTASIIRAMKAARSISSTYKSTRHHNINIGNIKFDLWRMCYEDGSLWKIRIASTSGVV
jgi:hypothetical protein